MRIMRSVQLIVVAAFVLAALAGCKRSSTVQGEGGKELTLTVPASVKVERGGTAKVEIQIGRKNFTDAVSIDFPKLPDGISIADGDVTVNAGPVHVDVDKKPRKIEGDKAVYTLKASASAALVDGYVVDVTAKGPGKTSVTQQVKLTVVEKP